MNLPRLQVLAGQIGVWADRNFDVSDPALGVLEELGEIAHCILKRKQGIRGFDDEAHFLAELADGIADAVIYCLHDVSLRSIELDEAYLVCEQPGQPYDRLLLGYLGQLAGLLLSGELNGPGGDQLHSDILTQLNALAAEYAIDFERKLEETWAKVSQRDWRANPSNAAAVVAKQVLEILEPNGTI